MKKTPYRRLLDILGEEESEQFFARLLTAAPTMLDCILIEWLFRPTKNGKRRRMPLVIREHVAMRRTLAFENLRGREGNDGVLKNVLADMPGKGSLRTISRSRDLLKQKGSRVVQVPEVPEAPEADD
jgi:hypothetical protein